MELENRSHKNVGIFLGIMVIVLVVFVTLFLGKKSPVIASSEQTTTEKTQSPSQSTSDNNRTVVATTPTDTRKKSSLVYKNGTYSATGSYDSPGGLDQIRVTLTLANDIINEVSVVPEVGDNTSARYQDRFISGYKQYVVGKNIADVNLTKISGSSLTPIGFDDALNQIKSQAKI